MLEEGRAGGRRRILNPRRARYERVEENPSTGDDLAPDISFDENNNAQERDSHDGSSSSPAASPPSLWDRICDDWRDCRAAIRNFPQDIYWIFALKFLESYSYFALSQILVIYLHTEFHVSDIEAGMVYGMW